MSEHHFGVLQNRRIPASDVERIDAIAQTHGCCFVQIKDGNTWKAWFSGPNRGEPFDRAMATAVLDDVEAAGLGAYWVDEEGS